MDSGIVGVIAGSIIDSLVARLGPMQVSEHEGPRERQFMVRAAIAAWVGITLFPDPSLCATKSRTDGSSGFPMAWPCRWQSFVSIAGSSIRSDEQRTRQS